MPVEKAFGRRDLLNSPKNPCIFWAIGVIYLRVVTLLRNFAKPFISVAAVVHKLKNLLNVFAFGTINKSLVVRPVYTPCPR